MRHKSVADDKAQWDGRPLGMYETLKHGSDCISWVVLSNAAPVVPWCLKIALWAFPLELVRPSVAQFPVVRDAGRRAVRNKPTQTPRKETSATPASQE